MKATPKTMLRVDTTEVQTLAHQMKDFFTPKQLQGVMGRAFKRTGQQVRTMVAREIRNDYQVNYGYALHSIGLPRIKGGEGIQCVMPVVNARKKIARAGGSHFFKAVARSSTSGRKMSAKRFRAVGARGGYAVQAAVLKSGMSSLPGSGENAHFMVSSGSSEGKVYAHKGDGSTYMAQQTYRRKDGSVKTYKVKKASIRPAVGIGVPQMPMNRSADTIQAKAQDILLKRTLHEAERELEKMAKK